MVNNIFRNLYYVIWKVRIFYPKKIIWKVRILKSKAVSTCSPCDAGYAM